GTEHEPHWNDSAELWISAVIGFVVSEAPEGKRSLQIVRNAMSNPELLRQVMQRMATSDTWEGLLARWAGQMQHPAEKERGSILSAATRNMAFLDSLAVAESVASSTFDPADLRKGKVTVSLVVPPDKMRINTGLLRMWISTLLREVVRQGLGEKKLVHAV